MSKVNQPISVLWFKKTKCRFCAYLHRYRYRHNKDQFKEYAEKYDIRVRLDKWSIIAIIKIRLYLENTDWSISTNKD